MAGLLRQVTTAAERRPKESTADSSLLRRAERGRVRASVSKAGSAWPADSPDCLRPWSASVTCSPVCVVVIFLFPTRSMAWAELPLPPSQPPLLRAECCFSCPGSRPRWCRQLLFCSHPFPVAYETSWWSSRWWLLVLSLAEAVEAEQQWWLEVAGAVARLSAVVAVFR